MTTIRLQPVRVRTGSNDSEGRLVFADDLLAAVLVQLSDEHGTEAGAWFLEAGFGRLDRPHPPSFASLDQAAGWITQRLAGTL